MYGNEQKKEPTMTTKVQYLNCVQEQKCQALDCQPDQTSTKACVDQKNAFMDCQWENEKCNIVPDQLDYLGWDEQMPYNYYQCMEQGECGANKIASYQYYRYQKCFQDCLVADV
ncbi:hypothetical protein PPERSA_01183 [Pseudocohnilembus persalinus]|uniref:Uncharacterized protein n=1 Tax=Pseudocohnilembus persalinus TaxID=266149 RepID=A0A0V0R1L8_PSEPJ|nr:hypothetical protein PPERSA_01183 [Pseudocohnilembus persalinus]|eukprot:KRX08253.1 hypothetical protein PPERSA_01183 [Pseudocohnilembus persalinus]